MKKTLTIVGICLSMLGPGAVQAALTVNFDAGTTIETDQITNFPATGATMGGMTVTAYSSGLAGGYETLSWAVTGPEAGRVSGSGWSLQMTGDTYDSTWTLTTTNICMDRLLLDGGPGNTVFDRYWEPFPGTSGSADGHTFEVTSDHSSLDITATYVDLVALSGQAPVGDLYGQLDVVFNSGLATGSTMTFIADTDNVSTVPAPGALMLVAMGTSLAGYLRRRKTL